MKVLSIIVTYNGIKWIDKCLNSLVNSTLPVDIVVIDNCSIDGTPDFIQSKYPTVRLIKNDVNLYFGKANNLGLRIALNEDYDYAFLLNQDAYIEEKTLEHLVTLHYGNKDYGILSPFHLNWDGSKVDHYFLQMANPNDCPDFLSDIILNKQRLLYEFKFIHAACWLISKNCMASIGGFDPLFKHYGEDNDYVNRAKLKGFKVGICPHVKIFHSGYYDTSEKLPSEDQRYYLVKIQTLLELKTPQNSILGNYIYFVKSQLDKFTTLLLKRKFRNAFYIIKILFFSIRKVDEIIKSRKETKKQYAFIQ